MTLLRGSVLVPRIPRAAGDVERTIVESPQGLRAAATDGTTVWDYDGATGGGFIYAYDYDDGTHTGTLDVAIFGAHGLSHGAGHLWLGHQGNEEVYKIDPATGSVVSTLAITQIDGSLNGPTIDVAYDPVNDLLYVGQDGDQIWAYDAVTGSYMDTLFAAGPFCLAVSDDGGTLYAQEDVTADYALKRVATSSEALTGEAAMPDPYKGWDYSSDGSVVAHAGTSIVELPVEPWGGFAA